MRVTHSSGVLFDVTMVAFLRCRGDDELVEVRGRQLVQRREGEVVDDFALRRGLVYATILIDAETGRRVDVLEGRTADVMEDWLREHPGVEVVTRDGSGAYGEAVRSALPAATQVSDRWHLWQCAARRCLT